MKYGYIRVSSQDQNIDRQLSALQTLNIDFKNIYIDKNIGIKINKELNILLKKLKEGDELIVLSLDRLGRSLINNQNIIDDLVARRIDFFSMKENIKIVNGRIDPFSKAYFQIISSISELERNQIKDRQKAGIEERKKRLGKRYNVHAKKKIALLQNKTFRNEIKHYKKKNVMEKWNISSSTYHNYKREIIG